MFLLNFGYSSIIPKQKQDWKKEPYILVMIQLLTGCVTSDKNSFVLSLNFRFLLCRTETMICEWQSQRTDQYPIPSHETPPIYPLEIPGNWGKQIPTCNNYTGYVLLVRDAWRVMYKGNTRQEILGTQYLQTVPISGDE